jgi:hypothetical protein
MFRYGDPNSPIEAVRFFGVSPDVSLIDGRRDWLSAAGVLEQGTQDWMGSLGVGLRGMSERLHQLGGALEITSSDNGTRVRATVPI